MTVAQPLLKVFRSLNSYMTKHVHHMVSLISNTPYEAELLAENLERSTQ